MGEPAFQLPEDDRPDIRPRLRSLEGGGESTPRSQGHLRSVGGGSDSANAESGQSMFNPEGDAAKGSGKGGSALGKLKSLGGMRKSIGGALVKLLKNKLALGLIAGSSGILGILFLILIMLGALKIPHLAENITAYQFARVFQQAQENNQAITDEKIAVDTADDASYGKIRTYYESSKGKAKDQWSKLDKYRPNKVIENMGTSDQLKFNYQQTAFGRQKLVGITMGDKSVLVNSTPLKDRLIPGYKFLGDIKLAGKFQPALTGALHANDIGPIVRGLTAKEIRQRLGISLTAWVIAKYQNKDAVAAARQEARDAAAKIGTENSSEATTAALKNAEDKVRQQSQQDINNDQKLDDILKNGGRDPQVEQVMADSVKSSGWDTALSWTNPLYAVAMPACIIYDGSIEHAGATIDANSAAQMKEYQYIASAADQEKDGTNASEPAIGALNNRLGDISASTPMERASGSINYTTNSIPSAQASPMGSFSLINVLLNGMGGLGGGTMAAMVNNASEKSCSVITNNYVAGGVAVVNIIGTILSLGTTEVGEESAAQAFRFGLQKIGDSIVEKFAGRAAIKATSKAAVGKTAGFVWDSAKMVGKIGAATMLAKLIVANQSGYLTNGLDSGNDTAENADAGGNLMANEIEREQMYGRPLNAQESSSAIQTQYQYVYNQNESKNTYQRYFALSNPMSLLSVVGTSMSGSLYHFSIANTLQSLGTKLINPLSAMGSVLTSSRFGLAYAGANPSDQDHGNVQWGWSAEERRAMKQPSYAHLKNQDILDASGKEDAIASTFSKCFDGNTTQGTLLQDGDIQRDDSGNVTNQGDCSPDKLTIGNRDYCYLAQGESSVDPNGCDLVFRWRLAQRYNKAIDTFLDEQTITQDTTTQSASDFTVASYNILHALSHPDNSRAVGGCNTNPVPGDPDCIKTRMDRVAQIITGTQPATNPAFDIVGTQETSPPQYDELKKQMPGYGVFPTDTQGMNNHQDGAVAVWWNNSKFHMIGNGKAPGKSNTAKDINNPWVELQSMTSGQNLYVMSIHYANSNFGGTDADMRKSAQLTMDWVRSKVTPTTPVIVMGDFNDELKQKLSYCVYTQNSLMQNTWDMSRNISASQPCPTNQNNGIDEVYVTPTTGITASGWTHLGDSGIYHMASDHTPVYVTLHVGSADNTNTSTAAAGSWNWPVDQKWWNGYKTDFLNAHTMISGTFTSPYAKGIAADISSPPVGTPEYSMLDGKVIRTNLCGLGDGMMIESKVQGGTLDIAYGHGLKPKFRVGDSVRGGQQILSLNGVGCKVSGPHLHIDMSFNGKHICPQDVFIAMGKGQSPDLASLTAKGIAPCGR